MILPLHGVIRSGDQHIAACLSFVYLFQRHAAVHFEDLRDLQPIGLIRDHNTVVDLVRDRNASLVNGQLPRIRCKRPCGLRGILSVQFPRNRLGVDAQVILALAGRIALFIGRHKLNLVFPEVVVRRSCSGHTPFIGLCRSLEDAILSTVHNNGADVGPLIIVIASVPLVECHRALGILAQFADEVDLIALVSVLKDLVLRD